MQTLETASFFITVYDTGLAEVTIKNNQIIEVDDVLKSRDFVTSILPNKKIFFLATSG